MAVLSIGKPMVWGTHVLVHLHVKTQWNLDVRIAKIIISLKILKLVPIARALQLWIFPPHVSSDQWALYIIVLPGQFGAYWALIISISYELGFSFLINQQKRTGWWFGTFVIFSFSWECHHPNWLSYFSEGLFHHCNWNHRIPPRSHGLSDLVFLSNSQATWRCTPILWDTHI